MTLTLILALTFSSCCIFIAHQIILPLSLEKIKSYPSYLNSFAILTTVSACRSFSTLLPCLRQTASLTFTLHVSDPLMTLSLFLFFHSSRFGGKNMHAKIRSGSTSCRITTVWTIPGLFLSQLFPTHSDPTVFIFTCLHIHLLLTVNRIHIWASEIRVAWCDLCNLIYSNSTLIGQKITFLG